MGATVGLEWMSHNPWMWGNLAAALLILVVLWWRGWLRPAAMAGSRGVDEQPAWIWASAVAMVFLSLGLGASAVHGLPGISSGVSSGSPKAQAWIQLGAYGAGLPVAFFLLHLLRTGAPKAGLPIDTRSLCLGLGLGVLALPVAITIGNAAIAGSSLLGFPPPDQLAHPVLKLLRDHPESIWTWIIAACAVLAAPIFEEALYRGLLQSFVLRVTGSAWASVLVASGAFVLAHVGAGLPGPALIEIGALGVIWGVVFERTKRLGVVIAMHVLFNAANLAAVLFGVA